MTLPTLFPEEFVSGYVGTVRQMFNLKSNKTTIRELHRRFEPDGGRSKLVIELVAEASCKSLEEVVQLHTLAPLSRAFAIENADCSHGSEQNKTRLRIHGNRLSTAYPQYCPSCAAEDREFWGLSYWRRYHQIHGIGYCLKHQHTTLIEVRNERAFENSPIYYLERKKYDEQGEPTKDQSRTHEFVRRYADICAGLLEISQPIGRSAVNAAICSRAHSLGLRISSSAQSTVFHDLIQTHAPKDWLQRYFPKFSGKQQSANLEQCCISAGKIISSDQLILLCAALYSSASDALVDLNHCHDSGFRQSVRRVKAIDPSFWKSPQVLKVYVETGFNTCAVAKYFKLTDRATRSSMEKRGYPGIFHALKTKAGEALKMFLTGASFNAAVRHADDELEEFGRLLLLAATPLAKLFCEQAEEEKECEGSTNISPHENT